LNTVHLPGTDVRCSRFIFGTASLFNAGTKRRRVDLLSAAVNYGFSHFDAAPYYGFGQAERDLAEVCRAHPAVSVTSKVGIYSPGGEQQAYVSVFMRKALGRVLPGIARPTIDFDLRSARASLEASLRRLGRERIDLYLLHEPVLDRVNVDEWHRWLEKCVTGGKVGSFGLAATADRIESFLRDGAALTPVLQVLDSLDHKEADVVRRYGREPQITYGYVSAALSRGRPLSVPDILRTALERNPRGAIIVSTRDPGRLGQYAPLASSLG
jgi:D-threo-aldose 1-dehydrogenase